MTSETICFAKCVNLTKVHFYEYYSRGVKINYYIYCKTTMTFWIAMNAINFKNYSHLSEQNTGAI